MTVVILGLFFPAILLSWLLPFPLSVYLCRWMMARRATRCLATTVPPGRNQVSLANQRNKSGWAVYMLTGGVALIALDLADRQADLMWL
jgi:hypothetical protein